MLLTYLLAAMAFAAVLPPFISGLFSGPLLPFFLFGLLIAPVYVWLERDELASDLPMRGPPDLVRTMTALLAVDVVATTAAYYLGSTLRIFI